MTFKLRRLLRRIIFRKEKNETIFGPFLEQDLPLHSFSYSPSQQVHINDLPIEILINIFMQFSLNERVNFGLVCKLWHKIFPDISQIYLISDFICKDFSEIYGQHQPLNIFLVLSGFKVRSFSCRKYNLDLSPSYQRANVNRIVQNHGYLIQELSICGEFSSSDFVLEHVASFTNLTCLDLIRFHIENDFSVLFSGWIQHFGHRLIQFRMCLASEIFADESLDLIVQHLNAKRLKILGLTLRKDHQLLLACKKFSLLTNFEVYVYQSFDKAQLLNLIGSNKLLPHLETFKTISLNPYMKHPNKILIDGRDSFWTTNYPRFIDNYNLIFNQFKHLRNLYIHDFFYVGLIESVCSNLLDLKSLKFTMNASEFKKCIQNLSRLKSLNNLNITLYLCSISRHNIGTEINQLKPLNSVRRLTINCQCLDLIKHFSIESNPKTLSYIFPQIRSLIIPVKVDIFELLIKCINQMIYLKKARLLLHTVCRRYNQKIDYIRFEKQMKMHSKLSGVQIEIFNVKVF